ncbi:hypothetical protein H0X06_01235 [Candidatus Dependentiae bacterium]|nr:hypothetical protein [Candidatus Dependentiae bacterium]
MKRIVSLAIVLSINSMALASESSLSPTEKTFISWVPTSNIRFRVKNLVNNNQEVVFTTSGKIQLWETTPEGERSFRNLGSYSPQDKNKVVDRIGFSPEGTHIEVFLTTAKGEKQVEKIAIADPSVSKTGNLEKDMDPQSKSSTEQLGEIASSSKEMKPPTPPVYTGTFEKISPPVPESKLNKQPELQSSSTKPSEEKVGVSDVPSVKVGFSQSQTSGQEQTSLSEKSSVTQEASEVPSHLAYSPNALKRIQEIKRSLGQPFSSMKIATNKDKTRIVTLDSQGLVQFWNGRTGEAIALAPLQTKSDVKLIEFSADGESIIMTTPTGTITHHFFEDNI